MTCFNWGDTRKIRGFRAATVAASRAGRLSPQPARPLLLAPLAVSCLLAILAAALPLTAAGLLAAEPPASVLSDTGQAPPPELAPSPAIETLPPPASAACEPARRCGLIPVCRRFPVTITKPHTEYRMESELVCEPGCGGFCGDCNATLRTQKRLLKQITEKKVTSYEYKVVWVCPACAGLGGRCPQTPRHTPIYGVLSSPTAAMRALFTGKTGLSRAIPAAFGGQ